MYDVKASDGRILNEQPLSFRDAVLFSCDADIDSEDTSVVVESTRKTRSRRVPWLVVLGLVASGVASAILAWRVAT